MDEWVSRWLPVVQLVLNGGALVGGVAIWRLYIKNLRATITSKDASIEAVEKSRDLWKDKAHDLEKRSPEVVERTLSERIAIRDQEIVRLTGDREVDREALRELKIGRAEMEHDLFRARGFRAMLILDEGDTTEGEETEAGATDVDRLKQSQVNVEYIGNVGVDSGQLMVTDPCYIDDEWHHDLREGIIQSERTEETVFPYSYHGASSATLDVGHGELAFKRGHAGAGVVFSTGWGDGIYPVYAEKHNGRIVRIYINVG